MPFLTVKKETINKFKTTETCEKCGGHDNLGTLNIFGLYRTTLCNKCWRNWDASIVNNPDWKLLSAINRYYTEYPTIESEKAELRSLSSDVTVELRPLLEEWLSIKQEE